MIIRKIESEAVRAQNRKKVGRFCRSPIVLQVFHLQCIFCPFLALLLFPDCVRLNYCRPEDGALGFRMYGGPDLLVHGHVLTAHPRNTSGGFRQGCAACNHSCARVVESRHPWSLSMTRVCVRCAEPNMMCSLQQNPSCRCSPE